jgi:CubicO group peptidase (beta-lactamase class C family)
VALSEQAFGHGGYTGTSLWIDPTLDLFVIMLSNRNHPFGRGNVLALQGTIADAAVHAVQRASDAREAARGTPAAALGRLQLPSEPAHPGAPAANSRAGELRRGGG